ncbi:MAG: class I SAM-dependent methyltransferase [Thermoleophilia bacterium]|nr:class I SAM-dependent methyltransferase [Gaiellaceae bacterium]MDW8338717.1 class I SAM-dependent methyltransferase [Thermoleophilia bacterium]
MADRRLDPPRSMPTYAVRAPLVRWLAEEARRAHAELGRYRVLDVGCGVKPYAPLFTPYADAYVGVDPVESVHAELRGAVEDLPVEDASFDVVLCNQVLEHCEDPARAVAELRRVTAPGGRVLASTHGVMVFHPSPADHWRWTHTGLEKLFAESASWASVRVTAASGTTACLAMIGSLYLDLALHQVGLRQLASPLVAAANALAEAIDARSPRLREPGRGTLHANYHVVAEVGR